MRPPATVVVAFTGPVDGLPPGVHGVCLDPDDPLAREWALLLVDRTLGTALTAVDRQRLEAGAHSLEAARTFTATWSFVRTDAVSDARRILEGIAGGLDPAVRTAALRALTPPARSARVLEIRFTAALTALVEALDRGYDRRRALGDALTTVRQQAGQESLTGLHNRALPRALPRLGTGRIRPHPVCAAGRRRPPQGSQRRLGPRGG